MVQYLNNILLNDLLDGFKINQDSGRRDIIRWFFINPNGYMKGISMTVNILTRPVLLGKCMGHFKMKDLGESDHGWVFRS